ncbi:DUF6884 domain-containing protein [Deinococcus sonorensis]|uniref:DUF6884 domain-containing protein n=2 Tax=Deinococcus sonorensis TaxID=309891 RepID=A0AAU7UFG6_9DEIO
MTNQLPSIIVISSCTGAKLSKPEGQLTLDDFRQGSEHVKEREGALKPYLTSAKRMYTGQQHVQVSQAFDLLSANKDLTSTLKIISAGYGLIDDNTLIAPYETTFNDLSSREVLAWSRQLKIHDDLNVAIRDYDIVVFLLGENYLKSAQLPLVNRSEQSFIFLASGGSARSIPKHSVRQAIMTLANKDAKRFGYGLVGLKGFLFYQLARMVAENPEVLRLWHADPQAAINALESWQENRTATPLLSLPESEPLLAARVDNTATPTDGPRLVPGIHRSNLGFNPLGLSSEEFYPRPQHRLTERPRTRFTVVINNRDKLKITKDEHGNPLPAPRVDRIWKYIEGYGTPDGPRGYLTSLAYHNPSNEPLPETEEGNIYDCGAWSYKNEPYPILKKKDGPLTPERAMRLYEAAGARKGIDIIVSPDMMILDSDTLKRAAEKIEVSLQFAQEMMPLAQGHRLMAVTHGTFEQRHYMMEKYLEMGYTHIALGSLAMKSSRDPQFVYKCVSDAVKYRENFKGIYIHVLGVSSIRWAATLTHLGVDSFDGSSMYMEAFTGGKYLQYLPSSARLIKNHKIVTNAPWSNELPVCKCPACHAMRAEGWDTRAQGGSRKDFQDRPYNGGNEANMGRAVHNINMYLRALNESQYRIYNGDDSLIIKSDFSSQAFGSTLTKPLLFEATRELN